jgi:hypothetical protein
MSIAKGGTGKTRHKKQHNHEKTAPPRGLLSKNPKNPGNSTRVVMHKLLFPEKFALSVARKTTNHPPQEKSPRRTAERYPRGRGSRKINDFANLRCPSLRLREMRIRNMQKKDCVTNRHEKHRNSRKYDTSHFTNPRKTPNSSRLILVTIRLESKNKIQKPSPTAKPIFP